ncbi:MAG: prenyltransferase [Gammaproteobacteria bacterium]|nr:MAG: prenyltransferase [Gammaproteobacteria bacterium]
MEAEATAILPGEPDPQVLRGPLRWVLATRPPFLLASLLPVLIGLASAWHDLHRLRIPEAVLTLVGALLAHAAVNVFNDYYDELNGTDRINTRRVFPFTGGSRFIQNGVLSAGQMRRLGIILSLATMAIGLWLTLKSGPELLLIGAAGLFLGWAYSAPPFSLNARGLGELAVAVGFGVLIPLGADYVQRGEMAMLPVLAGIPYALLVMNLLYLNEFPDEAADAASGKHHWVVRLGVDRARWGYLLIALLAYISLVGLVISGRLPEAMLLALLPAPASAAAGLLLLWHAHEPRRLVPAIRLTLLSLALSGVTLAAGLVLAA